MKISCVSPRKGDSICIIKITSDYHICIKNQNNLFVFRINLYCKTLFKILRYIKLVAVTVTLTVSLK